MAPINLSEKDTDLLKAYLQVAKASVDWDEVNKIAGLSSTKYARDKWATLRAKLIGSDAAAATPTEKKKATPRKRKAVCEGDDEETPTGKKKAARKGAKSKSEEPTQDGEDDNIVVKGEEPNEAGEAMDAMI